MRVRATSMGFRDWFTSNVIGFRRGVICRVVVDIGPWRLYIGRRVPK